MATTPGILTRWPWEPLGNFKYVVVAPLLIHGMHSLMREEKSDVSYLSLLCLMLWRMLHNQIWITLSRYRTAKGNNLIVDKPLEFHQVDRELAWDDQILFNGILLHVAFWVLRDGNKLPLWRPGGLMLAFLIHSGPVEFLYYWLHRALHHHFLYSRYHSHHHSSILTQPITSVIHPFAEHIAYSFLLSMPLFGTEFAGINSVAAIVTYFTYVDFMNNMGHCNFEFVPKWLFNVFPPLKYLMYTPSFHSLHHTQFRTNYSLFMPFYDYIYGTTDKSTDSLHEASLQKEATVPNVVHLTHITTPESIYHLRLGFPFLASQPFTSKWYLGFMCPFTFCSIIISRIFNRPIVIESNTFHNLKLQSLIIPRYSMNYALKWEHEAINKLIEDAILEADLKRVKVVSLGLLNQGENLNKNGEIYLKRNPGLKVKLVDGSSLAVGVVLNSIPQKTSKVVIRGSLSKVAYSILSSLCLQGIQVLTIRKDEYEKLKMKLPPQCDGNILFSEQGCTIYDKVWLVGDDLTRDEQLMAPKGSLFIPFSQFPPNKARNDCFYLHTPALLAPKSFANLHSCENWLGRRMVSAWRVAGIVHALEGWDSNECGDVLLDIPTVWKASLLHGFRPLPTPV